MRVHAKKRSPRRLIGSAIALSAALLISSCSGGAATQDSAEDSGGLDVVRVLGPVSMSLNVAFVGEELGYFAEEGLQIEEQDAGAMAEAAFLSNGQTDVVFTGATEILTGIGAGVDMRILYEYWYTAAEGVYVSEDSPITSVSELKGKTVGLASDSDLEFLKVALKYVGLTEADVKTIVVGDQGGVIADALKNGTIAAVSGSTGEERSLAGAGVPLRDITPKDVKDTPGETFVAMAKTVEEKPDVLQRFFRAWAKASYASTVNADVLLKMGDRNIPEATMDRVQAMIGVEQAHKTDPPNGVYGELRPQVWQRVADDLFEAGSLQQAVQVDKYIDDQFIKGANEFDKAQVDADVQKWADANL
ncbi:ABC transporter substrate-binding protein [Mycolicibacterium sp.]|uniref:ABC transporter substrate-binding protein n=1 Tax=Mycolicibacterium sp. TaxID=2320850 RepID=UPI003D0FD550